MLASLQCRLNLLITSFLQLIREKTETYMDFWFIFIMDFLKKEMHVFDTAGVIPVAIVSVGQTNTEDV